MLETSKECERCDCHGWIGNKICPDCINGYVYEPVQEDKIVFVNVYSITRHYGGPEEGGWWYNWDACIESIPVQNKYSDVMAEEMEKRYLPRKHGNIYSVLGGTDYEVRIEAEPKESETKERPHYE